jgi:hypothetical protein
LGEYVSCLGKGTWQIGIGPELELVFSVFSSIAQYIQHAFSIVLLSSFFLPMFRIDHNASWLTFHAKISLTSLGAILKGLRKATWVLAYLEKNLKGGFGSKRGCVLVVLSRYSSRLKAFRSYWQ